MKIVALADVAPQPWKNGGGVTRELLRLPLPGGAAHEWLLRVSVADIAADGPFSPFPGVTRWFAVLEGAGVHLDWAEDWGASLKTTSRALEFDGADAPDCALLDGPARDLNVMVRRGRARAFLGRAESGEGWGWPGGPRGVFTLRPLLLDRGGDRLALPAHALAWSDAADAAAWSLHAPAVNDGAHAQTASSGAPAAWWIGLAAA